MARGAGADGAEKDAKGLDADKGAGGRERKINEDLGSGRLAGRQHGGVGRGSAADLSELSEVTRAEGEDMETSREASGAQVSDAVGISPHARARAAWLLFSSRVQSAGQVSPTRLNLP